MPREAPSWWQDDAGLWPRLLAPLGHLYGAGVAARFALTRPARAGVPVICIGNPTVGGAGKTPTAIATAEILASLGKRPFFLSRGYGGRTRGPHTVDPGTDTAAKVGDEPLLLARTAPTVIATKRALGACQAVSNGADAIVMDDGFQNPGLAKDLSILVVDGETGIGNGRVLPAGPLRAPLAFQLERADALVVVGEGSAADPLVEAMGRRGKPTFRAKLTPAGDVAWANGTACVAFAGIGRPDKFFATLAALGARIAEQHGFPDHHTYSEADAEALLRAAEAKAAPLVTTEKDWLRIDESTEALRHLKAQARTLPVALRIERQDDYAKLLRSVLDR